MRIPQLHQMHERTRNVLASMFAGNGQQLRVIVSNRIRRPTLVMESRTLILNDDCGLYDLLLMARLMTRRYAARGHDAVDSEIVRRWVDDEESRLWQHSPGVFSFPGLFKPEIRTDVPDVIWKKVSWKALEADDFQGMADAELFEAPGIEWGAEGDDLAGLLNAVAAGDYPVEPLMANCGIDCVTMPLTLKLSEAGAPDMEHIERLVSEIREPLDRLKRCFARKVEGQTQARRSARRYETGVHLDGRRLASAVLARRTARPPRLFRRHDDEVRRTFDPSRVFVAHGVDLNALKADGFDQPRWNERALCGIAQVHRELNVTFGYVGFADRIVEVPNQPGRRLYLHVPVILKHPTDDRWNDGKVFARLSHVIKNGIALPGNPSACQPRQTKTLIRFLNESVEPEHFYHTLVYIGPRGLGTAVPESDELLPRIARDLETQIKRFHRLSEEAIVDTSFFYVPEELKLEARALLGKRSYVANMATLG